MRQPMRFAVVWRPPPSARWRGLSVILLRSLLGCLTASLAASSTASVGDRIDLPAQISKPRDTDDHLTTSTVRYKETLGDATATLDLYPYSLGTSIVFDVRQPDNRAPALELQRRVLDLLLTRLLHDHPEIKLLHFQLSGNREALIQPLNEFLMHSPKWDSSRGRPRDGQLGAFLTDTINSNDIAVALSQAFSAHGFSLKLERVGKIDIQRIPTMNGALLPLHIDDMSFIAVKNIK